MRWEKLGITWNGIFVLQVRKLKLKKCKNNMYKAITFWGGARAKIAVSWFEFSFFPHVAVSIYLKLTMLWACNDSVLHVATIQNVNKHDSLSPSGLKVKGE